MTKKHCIDEVLGAIRHLREQTDASSAAAGATTPHVNVQHVSLKPTLRSYQKRAVAWMLRKERYGASPPPPPAADDDGSSSGGDRSTGTYSPRSRNTRSSLHTCTLHIMRSLVQLCSCIAMWYTNMAFERLLSSSVVVSLFAPPDVIHPLYTEVTTAENQTVYYNKHNGWYVFRRRLSYMQIYH